MQEQIDFGDPCKRCGRPMVPRHADVEPGYVQHAVAGFCSACETAIRRGRYEMRTPLLIVDDGIVDEVAVERAAKGDRRVRVTAAELQAAAGHLRNMTLSDYDIAFILGTPLAYVRGEESTGEQAA